MKSVLLRNFFSPFVCWLVVGILLSSGAAVAQAGDLIPGGLTEYPVRTLSPDQAPNGGFEIVNSSTSKPQGWTDNGFVLDTTTAHSGIRSFRLSNADTLPNAQSASEKVFLKKGIYRISGWIKGQDLATLTGEGSGARLCLLTPGTPYPGVAGGGCTDVFSGTFDWKFVELSEIVITQDVTATLQLGQRSEPNGTAWFDDMSIQEQFAYPVEAFMLYPNYRGMLFDDQSMTVRLDVTVNPFPGTALADFNVLTTLVDESTGAVIQNRTDAAQVHSIAELDGSSLEYGKPYLAAVNLVRRSDNGIVYTYPAYRISKVSAARRNTMTMSFDDKNRFLVRGRPTFLMGVYDSGLAYSNSEDTWENVQFAPGSPLGRRLFEMPINFYLHYTFGKAPASAMLAMMNVLQRHGILYLQTGNCFSSNMGNPDFNIRVDDNYVRTLGAHPGLAGYYTMDECEGQLAPGIFAQNERLKRLDPDAVNFGASNTPLQMNYWRDAVDILAMDSYPIRGAEPVGGYPLVKVPDWAALTRETLKDSRPFMTVLEFFQNVGTKRWPTRAEIRDMSYMAITEGADGLMYWSVGLNALATACSSQNLWCDAKVQHYEDLKAVTTELKSLEPVLVAPDRPELLVSNSAVSAIRTRVKYADGKAYLIAYNYTRSDTPATFTWSGRIDTVTVYNESRSIPASGTIFTDTFGPNQSHVYVIEPPKDTTPPSIVLSPSDDSVVSGVVTISPNVTDDFGVAGVKIKLDGVDMAPEFSAAPYTVAWSTPALPNGPHTLTVEARDTSGNTSSAAAQVTVNNVNVKINFQPAASPVPPGYLVDAGAAFGDRGNSFSYGWNADNSRNVGDRNAANSPDQRYDTFAQMQRNGTFTWEVGLLNGTYHVRIVAGDPVSFNGAVYKINVEQTLVVDGTPSTGNRWIGEGSTVDVTVTDGRLTVTSAPGAVGNKICFIEITNI